MLYYVFYGTASNEHNENMNYETTVKLFVAQSLENVKKQIIRKITPSNNFYISDKELLKNTRVFLNKKTAINYKEKCESHMYKKLKLKYPEKEIKNTCKIDYTERLKEITRRRTT